MIPEPLRVTLAAAKALERMGIPYFVGGSLASSAHGVARATLDADIVAKLEPRQAGRFATAEDTLLSKLLWYRQGNQVSERQWRDVLGIMRVARANLDGSFLSKWAGELGVADLLNRALGEAGPRAPA